MHLPKQYYVRVSRPLGAEELQALGNVQEVNLDGELTLPSAWKSLAEERNPNWVSTTLYEGKNRQIRRMLKSLGIGVQRLIRVSLGPLALDPLPRGQVREL